MNDTSSNNYEANNYPTYITTNKPIMLSMGDLWDKARNLAGFALFYMKFLHPEIDWGFQKIRIEQKCYHLAKEWRNHYQDTQENRKWFEKWIDDFENEIENQC